MRQTFCCSGKQIILSCGSLRHKRTSVNPFLGLRHGEFACSLSCKFTKEVKGNSVQILQHIGKYPNIMLH